MIRRISSFDTVSARLSTAAPVKRAGTSGGSIFEKMKIGALCSILGAGVAWADAPSDYAEHCASCHGENRLGGVGPALIPETLKRMRGPRVAAVIAEGRAALYAPTQAL